MSGDFVTATWPQLTPGQRSVLFSVLLLHRRVDDNVCSCGWSDDVLDQARHVVASYERCAEEDGCDAHTEANWQTGAFRFVCHWCPCFGGEFPDADAVGLAINAHFEAMHGLSGRLLTPDLPPPERVRSGKCGPGRAVAEHRAPRRAMTKCQRCQREIRWATTLKGKAMPLDIQPDPARGNLVVGKVGPQLVARTLPAAEAAAARDAGDVLYISHWATCPGADEQRKIQRAKGR